jgi:hypothetical protein
MHLPPLRRQRRDLPRELGRAIDLSLRPRPGERGTLEELRAALVFAAGQVGDEPGVVADPWPARTERREWEPAGFDEVAAARVAAAQAPMQQTSEPDRSRRRGRGIAWLRIALVAAVTAALTAVLSGLGLATAWPALAGLAGRARWRVALAATGCLWAAIWTAEPGRPVISAGTLVACGVWALAAFTLPWTRSRRWPALEAVRLALWAVALGLGTALAARMGGRAPTGEALVGAFAGALVAFVTRAFAARLRRVQAAKESPPTS